MLVEIKKLIKRYNGVLAVDQVDLGIREGEIFGLLGPNGAGKTSLINTLLGLVQMNGGSMKIFGKPLPDSEMEVKKDLGVVPQEVAIYEDLTAYENVAFFGKLYGIKPSNLKEQVQEALNFTGLWERRGELPSRFSGGMKRRLNIACAIVHRPRLIVMDEPTVGIDPQSRNHILDSVRQLNQDGATVLYTSHYMEEVEALCTRIAIMDQGKVIARGTREELKELVAGEEKVHLKLTEAIPDSKERLGKLQQVPGVLHYHVADDTVTVTSNRESQDLSAIIEAVTSVGGSIKSVDIEKPTLETVFLTLTGKRLRD